MRPLFTQVLLISLYEAWCIVYSEPLSMIYGEFFVNVVTLRLRLKIISKKYWHQFVCLHILLPRTQSYMYGY